MPLERDEQERLSRIVDFFLPELEDIKIRHSYLTQEEYFEDRDKRLVVERCIENVVNASLDIAKIILVGEKEAIPDTYRKYFYTPCIRGLIKKKVSEALARGVSLRNILAHEYLDIRWERIKEFLRGDWKYYWKFMEKVKETYL